MSNEVSELYIISFDCFTSTKYCYGYGIGLLTHLLTANQHNYRYLLQCYWVCASFSSPSMNSHWYNRLANWSYVPPMFVVVASLMALYLDTSWFRYLNRAKDARRDLQAEYLLFHCADVDVWLMF